VNRFYHKGETGSGMILNHEFLSFRIAQKYYLDPAFGGAFKPGVLNIFHPMNTLTGFAATGIERFFSPISMSARLSPKPGISHDVRMDYDTKLSRLRNASVSSYWQQEKVFIAGTYFKSNALEQGMIESHHVQGQLGYGSVMEGLSASVSLSYNIRSSSLLNTHSRLHYGWDCCGVALEYQHFNLGLRTERRFNFSFTLKGIGSFGSLKRPESLF
jgi:LPS-assembly protein